MKYSHDSVVPMKHPGNSKKQQVTNMFDRIAFRYDLLNRLLTAGIDGRWRKRAIRELAEINPQTILDVATGTAEMAVAMSKYLQPKKIIGIDLSEGMLALGKRKIAKLCLQNVISLQMGDSEAINIANETFDAVTVAFGVRNFENLEKGLFEIKRVLKPGGKLVVLEFSRPSKPFFRMLCNVYMRVAARGMGKWVAKNPEAYEYLNDSVAAFPEGEDFANILANTGFSNLYFKKLSSGICTIYCASK